MSTQQVNIDQENNPWGLPDWREAGQYPNIKTTKIAQWKWEFIRRSPEYQAHWMEYSENKKEWDIPDKHGITKEMNVSKSYLMTRMKHPNNKMDNPFLAFVESSPGIDRSVIYSHDMMCERFIANAKRLNHCLISINPRIAVDEQLAEIKQLISLACKQYEGYFNEDLHDPCPYGSTSDNKKIKIFLDDYGRNRVTNYPLYLRLLDARSLKKPDRPTWREITAHLKQEDLPSQTIEKCKSQHKSAIKKIKFFKKI